MYKRCFVSYKNKNRLGRHILPSKRFFLFYRILVYLNSVFGSVSRISHNLPIVSKFGSRFPVSYLLIAFLDIFNLSATSCWVMQAYSVRIFFSCCPKISLYISISPLFLLYIIHIFESSILVLLCVPIWYKMYYNGTCKEIVLVRKEF